MGKHGSEHSDSSLFDDSFYIIQSPTRGQGFMAGTYAPTIMDEMVMKAWKDQWALLKPFLLE